MTKLYLGVDPGISGGIGLLDHDGKIVLAERMPIMPSPVYGKHMVDGQRLYDTLNNATKNAMVACVIERVSAMPNQGVTSSFNFGVSYGIAAGILGALQISHQFVLPRKWKGDMGLGADKDLSMGMAMRLWPTLKLLKKDDGIAEALLMAEWIRRKN